MALPSTWKSSGLLAAGSGTLKATAGKVKSVILLGTTTAGYVTVLNDTTVLIELRVEAGTAYACKTWNGGPVDFDTSIKYVVNGANCKAIVFSA